MSIVPDKIDQGSVFKVVQYGMNAAGAVVAPQNNSLGDDKVQQRELIPVTNTAAAGSAVTLTVPAAGAGLFNYLQNLQIVMYAAAALTGGATPVLVTTTGMPGNPAFTFPTAVPIGEIREQKFEGGAPIKGSTAATAITIVCPATPNVIWRVNAAYFQA